MSPESLILNSVFSFNSYSTFVPKKQLIISPLKFNFFHVPMKDFDDSKISK